MSFASLGLSDALVRAVTEEGYTEATPIQTKAIPAVLNGGDLLAGAQTGTGKTAGFVLPMLQRLATSTASRVSSVPPANGFSGHRGRKPLRALILTPTRELAAQVEESVRVYGKYQPLTSMVIFGGVSIGPQTAQLKRGVDILVATPGRLLDHHGQGNLDFSRVEIFVLDEADRMLDMGFIRDIKRVLKLLPPKRQNLLFSATFSDDIRALADTLLDRPALIEVAPRNATVDMIAQKVHPVDRDRKRELLSYLIGHNDWHQVLVFTRTKHGANKLAEQLNADGITALAIHGNKSQGARTRALAEFKQGGLQVLVATDIAARGIDIDQLPHVVNYDLPNVAEDYIHRIGRTGRAGASGEAISLVCVDEHAFLRDIERLLRREVPSEVVDGFKPDPHARAQPILQRAQRGNGSGRGTGRDHGNGKVNGSGHRARQNGPQSQAHSRISPRVAHPGGSTAGAPSRVRSPGKPAIKASFSPSPRGASTPRPQASKPAPHPQPAHASGAAAPTPYLSPAARSERPRSR